MADKVETGADAKFELSEHLPYLFKHIHSQLEVASAGGLAAFGINVAVWRILAVLWQHEDLSHRELSELTSIEVSTLSRLSKSVQRDGLIRRKRTPQDQRTVRVTLTEKGRELVKLAIPSAQAIEKEIVGKLSAAEVAQLIRTLHVIAGNLNRYSRADNLDIGVPKTPAGSRKAAYRQKADRASRSSPIRPNRVTDT